MKHIPTFSDKKELFSFLRANKSTLIATKKANKKECDAISFSVPLSTEKGEAIKDDNYSESVDLKSLKAQLVINTTNILDSHDDVHIPNLWNKSIKESKGFYLVQEHKMQFDKIIADKVKATTKTFLFSELGFPQYTGATQALVFEAEIKADRNEFMFNQYLKGYVNNHSVGMQYVNLFMCINSEDKYDAEEKANWDKYIDYVANKAEAEERGYFFAVTEAKIIEGSAVVIGSNKVTPTISITEIKEADNITSQKIEPSHDTQNEEKIYYLVNNFKL